MRQGEAIFDELRAGWERQIGADELAAVEGRLAKLVGTGPIRFDTPGWIAHDLGGST